MMGMGYALKQSVSALYLRFWSRRDIKYVSRNFASVAREFLTIGPR
jgi:hypothetical protein